MAIETKRIQVRQGTAAALAGITPAQGELCWATDTKRLFVGDGSTAGGVAFSLTQGSGLLANDAGFRGIPQNSKSAAYTLVADDAGKHIYHPGADTTARTWTIPANSSVAFEVGTTITFINDTAAGIITIAITSDTLVLAGAGTTGSRSLAANGVATAVKMTSTRWIISGTGLT